MNSKPLRLLIVSAILSCQIFLDSSTWADVSSTTGNIHFSPDSINTSMTLNPTGLGIGIMAPSTNLHVQGNSIVSQKLSVGSSTLGSSHMHVSGSWGFNPQTVTGNVLINTSSMILANSTSANVYLALPSATNVSGRVIHIKKISTANEVAIFGPIDSSPVITLGSGNMAALSIFAGQGNWHISKSFGTGTNLMATDNLQLWLDASRSDSFSYGTAGNVSTWSDLSGQNRHFTQASESLQPVYSSSGMNSSYPGVVFSGGQYMDFASKTAFNFLHSGNGMTMFIVASSTLANTTQTILDNGGYDSGKVGSVFRFHQDDFQTKITLASVGNSVIQALSTNNTAPANTAIVYYISYQNNISGNDYTFRINRIASDSGETSNTPSGASADKNMRLGFSHGSSNIALFGTISEIMAFDKVLSDTEILRIHTLLKLKYRI